MLADGGKLVSVFVGEGGRQDNLQLREQVAWRPFAGAHALAFDAKPPSVVLVGGEAERRGQVYPDGLDEPLVRWAADRNYRPVNLESGFTALVAPVDRR